MEHKSCKYDTVSLLEKWAADILDSGLNTHGYNSYMWRVRNNKLEVKGKN